MNYVTLLYRPMNPRFSIPETLTETYPPDFSSAALSLNLSGKFSGKPRLTEVLFTINKLPAVSYSNLVS